MGAGGNGRIQTGNLRLTEVLRLATNPLCVYTRPGFSTVLSLELHSLNQDECKAARPAKYNVHAFMLCRYGLIQLLHSDHSFQDVLWRSILLRPQTRGNRGLVLHHGQLRDPARLRVVGRAGFEPQRRPGVRFIRGRPTARYCRSFPAVSPCSPKALRGHSGSGGGNRTRRAWCHDAILYDKRRLTYGVGVLLS